MRRDDEAMRRYWDERARINAPWYVDTSLQYKAPDLKRFFESGREIVEIALDRSPVAPGGNTCAVEIGSGLGRICLALADRFDRVLGVDVSAEMCRQAREAVGRESVSFVVGDGVSLASLRDACADFVLSFTVFQHIPKISVIEGYIEETGRVLKPGGVAVLQWNNTPGMYRWAARRAMLAALQRLGPFGDRYGRNASEFLGSRVPLTRIERALGRGGMELRRTEGLGTLFAWAWALRT